MITFINSPVKAPVSWSSLIAVVFATLGVILALIGWLLFLGAGAARIDSADELFAALQMDRFIGLPMAVASLFLVLGFVRRLPWHKRFGVAVFIMAVLWLVSWQWIRQTHFNQVRARGGDPEQMLRSLTH